MRKLSDIFWKDLILSVRNLNNSRLTENDCGKHFPKSLFIEDVISQRLKVYKRKTW